MKKAIIYLLLFSITITYIFTGNPLKAAAVQVPQEIRVGLYFKSTAPDEFTVSSENGAEFGIYKNNVFEAFMYSSGSSDAFTVRKDDYLFYSDTTVQKYTPGDLTMPEGGKIGPYHVQLIGNCAGFSAAMTEAASIRQKGIEAYPAYTGVWEVWTGFYTDAADAMKDIKGNINAKLGEGNYNIMPPVQGIDNAAALQGITVLQANRSVAFLFADSRNILRIRAVVKAGSLPTGNPALIKVNGTGFRGQIEVRRLAGSDMTVINAVPLEQYIYGVVPPEIGSGAPAEALKAQAVVARTFAAGSLQRHADNLFNVCSTTHCQVYKGNEKESSNVNAYIDETAGKIITYNGRPIEALYFSTSGGRTEDSENVWGNKLDYLRSVDDPYESSQVPYHTWKAVFTASQIKNIFGSAFGDILSLNVTGRSQAGRVIKLEVRGTQKVQTLVNEQARTKFGYTVRSQWYDISTDADVVARNSGMQNSMLQPSGSKVVTAQGVKSLDGSAESVSILGAGGVMRRAPKNPSVYTFSGKGWGHALGMSQEGAIGMAAAGITYDKIIKHYYTNVEIE